MEFKTEWYGRPYNFFGDYLRAKYNKRLLKLSIDAGLGCPNRDGTFGHDGCVFCSEQGSASPTTFGEDDIKKQMQQGREAFKRSVQETEFIAYFQAYTNTYAETKKLKELYDAAIIGDDIRGLMIGTRPDCLSNQTIDLIASYLKDDFELWLEIGMQSSYNRSLNFLNRHHSYEDVENAVARVAAKKIPICLHVILGIPGESWDDMMKTAERLSALPIQGVKIHHLHVIKNTKLANIYAEKKFEPIGFAEYISTVCDFIERLRPDIIIHRLAGDKEESELIAPRWGLHKGTVFNEIEKEFHRRGTWQGFLWEK